MDTDNLSVIGTNTPGRSDGNSPVTEEVVVEAAPYRPVRRMRRPRLMVRIQQQFESPAFLWHVSRSQEEVDDMLLWERVVNFHDLPESVSHRLTLVW